ncbi:Ribose-5-phosphate isomerase [Zancudomyces culisetae]|uniref:Ribose-5-phosphate isomerase n=1 Tax=Zancudomyces culisetae TaxID=1213189 RepID=A0A1R1PZB5_ZANCU|nr:Ribose-5-phosphate isomerase [Zancudomyces culisetae]|eukprot:OMH86308.1 Ribose-5-phosphate isomerase [Zancudomyces culisetae]
MWCWTQGVPVEVVPFAYLAIANKLKNIKNTLCSATDNTAKRIFENDKPEVCMRTAVRKAGPVVTDNGNFVMDVKFGKIFEPALLENEIKMIPGVIEVGLFCSMAKESWFGNEDGTVSSRTI